MASMRTAPGDSLTASHAKASASGSATARAIRSARAALASSGATAAACVACSNGGSSTADSSDSWCARRNLAMTTPQRVHSTGSPSRAKPHFGQSMSRLSVREGAVLALHILLQHLRQSDIRIRPDLGCVEVAFGINRNRHRCARLDFVGLRFRIGNEVLHRSIFRAADPNPPLEARVVSRVRLCVGHIDRIVGGNEDGFRTAKLFPLVQQAPVLIEYLNAIVSTVAHEDAPLGIDADGVRGVDLAWAGSSRAP